MRTDLGLILTLVIGMILIVFNEIVGRMLIAFQNRIAPRERNEKLTRIICIMLGTLYVIYASISMFK
jgi:hypothetical protein